MRTLPAACAVTAAAAATLLLPTAAFASPPGDNGTVKIHDAETGEDLKENDPHVCEFYLDAFGFDDQQDVDWKIVQWPPTAEVKGKLAKSGSIVLDDEGHGRTEDMTLPDGHYKLIWNFEGENGRAKHKVFWTDCEDDTPSSPSPSTSTSASPTPSESASTPASPTPSNSSATPTESSGTTPNGSATPTTPAPGPKDDKGDKDGSLAETGASVVGISLAALALLAGGAALIWRRKSHQH
ncbi:hypothetical protein AQ490_07200 [Wenjunlia vitaminophila]|uniref:Uncharacterized protein n=1 Tax=Wenjunlia vitaminophila TaxID=76728 RepID=A0A0T6LMS0_WENVI|nr:LPXTG cell wall anchor domain-containing protein [Wenjunlia vitaminophila]KRV47256.1 hypothetical protein AQ490_07200 [Wenjunlia vitaminophila]